MSSKQQQKADRLNGAIEEYGARLQQMDEKAASTPRAAGKWTPKQIVGHLTDAASNNHQRFVRMQEQKHVELPRWSAEHWVNSQRYHERQWSDVVALWIAYNRHLAHVIAGLPNNAMQNTCTTSEAEAVTLEWVIDNYVEHTLHHMDQIFPKS